MRGHASLARHRRLVTAVVVRLQIRASDGNITSSTQGDLVALYYLKIVRRLVSFRVRTFLPLFIFWWTLHSLAHTLISVSLPYTSQLLFISLMHFFFPLRHFLYPCMSLTCTQCSHAGSPFISSSFSLTAIHFSHRLEGGCCFCCRTSFRDSVLLPGARAWAQPPAASSTILDQTLTRRAP